MGGRGRGGAAPGKNWLSGNRQSGIMRKTRNSSLVEVLGNRVKREGKNK